MQLNFTGASWRKSTRCDNSGPNCVEVAVVDGGVGVRDTKGTVAQFDNAEWAAFVAGNCSKALVCGRLARAREIVAEAEAKAKAAGKPTR